jgi:hypothetical protein
MGKPVPLFFCYQRSMEEPVASWVPIPLDREKEEEKKR